MFSFNIDKLIHTIIFLYKNTDNEKLNKTKLVRLLYYSDFRHMKKYSRPIIGDTYIKLPIGPVPLITTNLIYDIKTRKHDLSEEDLTKHIYKFKNAITIFHDENKSTFIPLIKFNQKVFSKSDLIILKEVAIEFYKDDGTKISEKIYNESGWVMSEEGNHINYKFAFYPDDLTISEDYNDYCEYWEKTLKDFHSFISADKSNNFHKHNFL